MELTDLYKSKFAVLEQGLNGLKDTSFHSWRIEALDHFLQKGYPTLKDEAWKYSNLAPLATKDYLPYLEKDQLKTSEEIQYTNFDSVTAHRLVFVNGFFSSERSTLLSDDKINIINLDAFLKSDHNKVDEFLQLFSGRVGEGLANLNTAFFRDGAVIEVPDNVKMQHPVMLIFITTNEAEHYINQPHNFLIAGKNSKLVCIENHQTTASADALFTNAVTDIICRENSSTEYYKMLPENVIGLHVSTARVHQEKDSRFTSFTVNFGGKWVRNNIIVKLVGPNAEAYLNGLYLTAGTDHLDNHLVLDHVAHHCYSSQLYKGLLNDQSTGTFNGKVIVRPDAQKTNAFQANNNILLSERATINTKPELEIYADDVKCSHGATAGQLDETALFYMKSRGLDEKKATAMLIEAFAEDVVEKINIPTLRNEIELRLKAFLNK